ncbi:hypothetical protein EYF80_049664 [Liparis tanakae]|uniref:Uncharacterized protein n=1 Tax=Liparis tanakae TaxID=230148 RepID=A0A4Z2FGY4_9TELE|nr:hypothetical protein EYF80_049664 [Liparis tanakae]
MERMRDGGNQNQDQSLRSSVTGGGAGGHVTLIALSEADGPPEVRSFMMVLMVSCLSGRGPH